MVKQCESLGMTCLEMDRQDFETRMASLDKLICMNLPADKMFLLTLMYCIPDQPERIEQVLAGLKLLADKEKHEPRKAKIISFAECQVRKVAKSA